MTAMNNETIAGDFLVGLMIDLFLAPREAAQRS